MKHSLNYVSFDVFSVILQYLDLRESLSFITCCKPIYYKYRTNKHWCDIFLIHKFSEYFRFHFSKTQTVTSGLVGDSFSLYKHFKNHIYSNRIDFIFYMIEKDLRSLDLFRLILSGCVLREVSPLTTLDQLSSMQTLYPKSIDARIVTPKDLQYLLTYCNTDQLQIVFRTFTVPCEILAYTVTEIIRTDKTYVYQKIRLYIDYILYKHYFNGFNSMDRVYFNYICVYFIKQNDTTNLKYLFLKCQRYKVSCIDYQSLVNRCIEIEDTENLQVIVDYCTRPNANGIQIHNISISDHHISTLLNRHSFRYLQLLTNLLQLTQIAYSSNLIKK